MKRLLRGLWGAISLVHPFPVATVVATSALLITTAHRSVPGPWFMVRSLSSVLLSQMAVGALNDYIDRADDSRVQPNKPIPAGRSSPETALTLVFVASVLVLPIAASFGALAFCLVVAGTAVGMSYDIWLKKTPWSFSTYIAGFGLLFLWTRVISGRDLAAAAVALVPASLLVVAAHLAQSFPDIETDAAIGSRGLAVVLGPRRTQIVIFQMYVGAFVVAVVSAIAFRSWLALVLSFIALALPLPILGAAARSATDLGSRRRVFHFVAPGLALLAVSCVISWRNVL